MMQPERLCNPTLCGGANLYGYAQSTERQKEDEAIVYEQIQPDN